MGSVNRLEDIPFMPISTFKSHTLKCGKWETAAVFESSGTAGDLRSKHHIKSLELYRKSFLQCFGHFYGNLEEYTILALLPSYLEREGSSLVYMVDEFIRQSNYQESGFFLHDHDRLKAVLDHLGKTKRKVILIGVSFALLDFVEKYQIAPNPNLTVMETGGMKGRRKELLREELHEILKKGFSIDRIHSEYGMTELLSQAYSKGEGRFYTPQWMKVMIRAQDDPFSYTDFGKNGAINVIDLANIYSLAFIQTDDLGRAYPDGGFEVLGRFDQAAVRGCNLMVSE